MTEPHYLAAERRFDGRFACTIVDLGEHGYALYPHGGTGEPFYLGDGSALLDAFRRRPEFIRRTPPPEPIISKKLGLDLSALNFNL